MVCQAKSLDTSELMYFCRNLDIDSHPDLNTYHIHGWLIQYFDKLRAEKKIEMGTNEKEIEGVRFQYTGEIN